MWSVAKIACQPLAWSTGPQPGQSVLPGDICQCLEPFLIVTTCVCVSVTRVHVCVSVHMRVYVCLLAAIGGQRHLGCFQSWPLLCCDNLSIFCSNAEQNLPYHLKSVWKFFSLTMSVIKRLRNPEPSAVWYKFRGHFYRGLCSNPLPLWASIVW